MGGRSNVFLISHVSPSKTLVLSQAELPPSSFSGYHWSILDCHNDWGCGWWGRVAVSIEWKRTRDASHPALHRIVLHNNELSHVPLWGNVSLGIHVGENNDLSLKPNSDYT